MILRVQERQQADRTLNAPRLPGPDAALQGWYESPRWGADWQGHHLWLTDQLTDGGPSAAPKLPDGVARPPFGGAAGSATPGPG